MSRLKRNDAEEVTEDGIEFRKSEEYYKAGTEFVCPQCDAVCKPGCSEDGSVEIAHCENCGNLYRREREHLVSDLGGNFTLNMKKENRDVYEEYDCPYCDKSHGYTKPEGEWFETG